MGGSALLSLRDTLALTDWLTSTTRDGEKEKTQRRCTR
jgi:hypothetical protein